jgi:putative FmdB family regulatory protein
MPIYEYRCKDCGHVTAFLERPGAKKRHACEKCGSPRTAKRFSTFAVHAGTSSSGDSSCPTGTCSLPR